MKVSVNNLGPIKEAEFEIGDLTIICGENNTGKSYLIHATHGFLKTLPSMYFSISQDIIGKLMEGERVTLKLADYRKNLNNKLMELSREFSEEIGGLLAGSQSQFKDVDFHFQLDINKDSPPVTIPMSKFMLSRDHNLEFNFRMPSVDTFPVEDELQLEITPSSVSENSKFPDKHIVEREISRKLRDSLLSRVLKTMISTAERTGISIFQKELDFVKNRLWDILGEDNAKPKLSLDLLRTEFGGSYPLAIRNNIDFIRWWPSIVTEQSKLLKLHPEIKEFFTGIIGGDLRVTENGVITFTPATNRNLKLNLHESSSTVKSLLDINFYILHDARPGDILIIDEPELNLHPGNQCKMARLFARLVNAGIKIIISTHSDYILKELNTLIMLNDEEQWIQSLAKEEGYDESELIRPDQIRAYRTKPIDVISGSTSENANLYTLAQMEIDNELGIDGPSFDPTIDRMNRIQNEIIFGGDE